MFIFKKSSKRLKRMVSVVLCVIFSSYLFVLPVFASEVSYQGSFTSIFSVDGVLRYYSAMDTPSSGSSQSVLLSSTPSTSFTIAPYSFYIGNVGRVSGYVGIYTSFYLYVDNPDATISSYSFSSAPFYIRSISADGVESFYDSSSSIATFSAPYVEGRSVSKGYVLKSSAFVDDSFINLDSLSLQFNWSQYNFSISSPSPVQPYLCVPSSRFIYSSSPSDLGALENIADSITAQSEILNSMYGDIMQLLNDLYQKLGDLDAAADLANAYFAQLIPLINSINTNTSNIYSLLQTQFQLLRTLIATESGNIQDAIEQQTDDLISYFDTVFSDAVGSMPEKSDDLQTSVDDYDSAESQYQSNAATRFDELASTFTGFSGGTLAGVTLASTLFSRVWSALGSYNIVYFYPLLLGLCLVVIGRLGKSSGGQSSSEKHRGDSSA